MKRYKYFLSRICDIENVSIKDIVGLTGKSQSVVYDWFRIDKDSFPSIESLGKILFRLGISFDDFINLRHPIYDDGCKARIYYQYVKGPSDQSYFSDEILDLPNVDDVIDTYIRDRILLSNMINNYVNGIEIDKHRFDILCKALIPNVISDIITEGEQSIFFLCSDTLYDYKLGLDCIKEIEEESEDTECEIPVHKIIFPDANNIFLLVAEKKIDLLEAYLDIIDENEKRFLLECYVDICTSNPDYDKNKKIIKLLMENDCEFSDSEDNKEAEKYRELLKRIINVR